jgi:hypothetical protein
MNHKDHKEHEGCDCRLSRLLGADPRYIASFVYFVPFVVSLFRLRFKT